MHCRIVFVSFVLPEAVPFALPRAQERKAPDWRRFYFVTTTQTPIPDSPEVHRRPRKDALELFLLPGHDTSKLGLNAVRSMVGLVPQERILVSISEPSLSCNLNFQLSTLHE